LGLAEIHSQVLSKVKSPPEDPNHVNYISRLPFCDINRIRFSSFYIHDDKERHEVKVCSLKNHGVEAKMEGKCKTLLNYYVFVQPILSKRSLACLLL
jgi:hypothetical protein